ncbi:MAG: EamA family transporter [Flavobacteriales bacterium]
MQPWIINALLAMLFAGITAVLAKYGLKNVHPDFALGIRTTVIFALVLAVNLAGARFKEWAALTTVQLWLLIASGVTTTLSWLYYYRAMKDGPVSYVAAIDKGSIVITLVLSFLLLREPVTAKVLAGGGLVLAGLVVLVWK